ncbi:MAG: nucleotidyl transferase AbiEii/AbiGii toxin family protein [Kiritimatiellae bacterium]|nr:nucleotidyl transferase AbiEii/AbiGii toxin family protein [Kiritimatiellia bacterium]
MLHTETVLPSTLDILKRIQALPNVSELRLVGGTALALHIGHRKSVDLDLFGSFDENISFRSLLLNAGYQPDGSEAGAVQSLKVNGVKVDFVNYPYPWMCSAISEGGVILADIHDIAAMKLSAAANRGRKKDFIDISFLLDEFSLNELFSLYQKKFSVSEYSFALRGLTYFDDAEDDPMPEMLTPTTWKDVKLKIASAVREFVNGM